MIKIDVDKEAVYQALLKADHFINKATVPDDPLPDHGSGRS